MKRVLVLGTGLVAPPLIDYLLQRYKISVSDIDRDRAQNLMGNHPNGQFLEIKVNDPEDLRNKIQGHDLVVSLLPPPYHPKVAQACLDASSHLVTASYIGPEMSAYDDLAREKGLIFLNEMGLDPGLDHMTVMEVLDIVRQEGGTVRAFYSHAGGLPSRKAATNPLRYKFSWSPRGVLGALTRPSKFRLNNEMVVIQGPENLDFSRVLHLPGIGVFESNPNADSIFYAEKYGLSDTPTVRRSTLRFPGWGIFWRFMIKHNLMDSQTTLACKGLTPEKGLLLASGPHRESLKNWILSDCGDRASFILEVLDDLGVFGDELLTEDLTAFEIILQLAQKRWQFEPGETDWVVMVHELTCDFPSGPQLIRSSFIREGIPDGLSAMAVLVGLPAAIGARLVLDGHIQTRGVLAPMTPDIYRPVLEEMQGLGYGHRLERLAL